MVMCGGALGTLCRYWLNTAIPSPGGWPLPTLIINLCGAFALGLLLEALATGAAGVWVAAARRAANPGNASGAETDVE